MFCNVCTRTSKIWNNVITKWHSYTNQLQQWTIQFEYTLKKQTRNGYRVRIRYCYMQSIRVKGHHAFIATYHQGKIHLELFTASASTTNICCRSLSSNVSSVRWLPLPWQQHTESLPVRSGVRRRTRLKTDTNIMRGSVGIRAPRTDVYTCNIIKWYTYLYWQRNTITNNDNKFTVRRHYYLIKCNLKKNNLNFVSIS